ncbi:TPA: flagellar motor switch protein FliM [Bacillus thuringiensis]|uniref:flagellar motor switch protein FliM n=1 Tax=Bacillus TaxID=1386 RepID=UPI00027BF805|nr:MULTISPECIES: flagellar motor switch protein FliM [Bacillus]HDR3881164.1 flagellar motor switch protein FliM [Bacillus cereus]EJV78755.1 flagellar motor switch protein FliM [Bacillus cereus HuB1-1]MED3274026.1 flagellar motor switch protein FliM [Bacillus thuringiensis]MED3620214.1 flagellar motor switch protein FliM [Bacillus thuringiensis]OTW58068.1 flagellar motor switch protein FliM [Bacillus thuringiensis serovar silo]
MSGEKLSQEQIDALLKAVNEGEEMPAFAQEAGKQEKFQEYDFNRPEKFGVEHLRSLQAIASTFGKQTSQTLSARMRIPIELEPSTVEQVPFTSEYVEKMPKDYYLYCVIDLGLPELGEIVIEIDLAFVIYIHECWLGGDSKRNYTMRRPLTAFEFLTLDNIFLLLCKNLEQSFESVVAIEPKFVTTETDPNALKITTASDIISLLNVNMKTDFWNTTVRIGIPFLSVEEIMDKLTSENIVEHSSDKRRKYTSEVEVKVNQVYKPVHVAIGEQKMTMSEIEQIEEGDIIPLHTKVSDELLGYVDGKHKFNCFIGKDGTRKALLFKSFVE